MDMGEIFLNIVIEKGYEQVVRIFIDFGVDVEGMDYMENMGLYFVVEKGDLVLVKVLLEKGVSFDYFNIVGIMFIMVVV